MSIFSTIWGALRSIAEQVGGLSASKVVGFLWKSLPAILSYVTRLTGTKEQKETAIRALWDKFDQETGLERDLIHDLPGEVEEQLFDGFKQVGLTISLWVAGVYGDPPAENQVRAVLGKLPGAFDSALRQVAGQGDAQVTPAPAMAGGVPLYGEIGPGPSDADLVLWKSSLEAIAASPQTVPAANRETAVRGAVLALLKRALGIA